MTSIRVMWPSLPTVDAVRPYLERMDAARIYSNFGPLVTELESRYAAYLGVAPDAVVSVASATLGITGAISVSQSASWLAPVWTFPATGLAVIECGRQVEFRDIDPDTWTLAAGPSMGGSDTGVLPVVPFGGPVDVNAWPDWDEGVLDAAASLGTQPDLDGLRPGWAVVFSLHATKVLGCGEGGLVVFGDVDRARRFRAWTNFGFMGSRVSTANGTNAKMSELAAAYALAALDGWPVERAEWQAAHARAVTVAEHLGLSPGPTRLDGTNPYWIVDFGDEDRCIDAETRLTAAGVQTRRWWPSLLTEMPAFGGRPTAAREHPVAYALSRRVLGLPMYRGMGTEVADAIVAALGER